MMATPRVVFRADAGPEIGLGHARRCLTLAGALRELGLESVFVCGGDRRASEWIEASGFEVVAVEPARDLSGTLDCCRARRARVIIVDSPSFLAADLRVLTATGLRVAVIDDLADRELPVDLVVNGGAAAEQLQYRGTQRTRFVLGPRYALLRPEFAQGDARSIADRAGRILVTVGGGDPGDLTSRLVAWTARALGAVDQDAVVGPFSVRTGSLLSAAESAGGRVALHHDPKDLAALMRGADLAVSGGGQTTYELAATGTPTLAIRLADNQTQNLAALAEAGTLAWVGDAADADLETKIVTGLTRLGADRMCRERMSGKGRALVDGGGAPRVAHAVAELWRA